MKDKYKDNFRNIYNVIIKNVSAIEGLIRQSEELENIISSLSDEQNSTKDSLESLKREISQSIGKLLEQTKTLSHTYNKFLEEVFGK